MIKQKARSTKQLGHALRAVRKARSLTQQELAAQTGLRQPTISDVENGKNANTHTVFQILNILGAEIEFHLIDPDAPVFDPEEFYGN